VPLKHQELQPLMAQRHVPEDFHLQKHGCKNLKLTNNIIFATAILPYFTVTFYNFITTYIWS